MICLPIAALWVLLSESHQHGIELYQQKKYMDAIAALEQAAKSEGEKTAAYKESVLLIGKSYFMLAQAPKSIPWLEKLPESTEANYMLGYAYLQTKRQDLAETAFARLFGVKPESAGAHLLAGQMMLKKEYAEEAAVEVRRALELDSRLPEAHFILGEIAMFRGRVDEGLEEMRRELALNPNFFMAWYRLGDAYARKENWGLAIPNLQRAIWLGCARKYVAMLNSPENATMLITSLSYFSNLVDEVADTSVGADYWKHVQHKVAQLEGMWRSQTPAAAVTQKDEMRETK